ncbi:MAG: NAD(P)/FAD-dependent oxidoreductase, partial [Bacteroidota bacterium]|nr:NAD(P)/FAD-dependent oxidoreductase [Bacteroidota bacterium]
MDATIVTQVDYDAVIIGAGPAGLFCGISCANPKFKVALLEKNSSPGKKLLMAGTGQCNLTHSGNIKDFLVHYGQHGKFVRPSLFNYDNLKLINFFEQRGLRMTELHSGKIFPESLRSKDVLEIMLESCKEAGVDLIYNSPAKSILKQNDHFIISTPQRSFSSRKVIITTGGMSYPATGSTGDGYHLSKILGHSIIEPSPALTPVIVKDYSFAECAGISIPNAKIFLFRCEKKIHETRGDLLFTHKGLSGPGILDFSRYIAKGDLLKVQLADFRNEEEFESDFLNQLHIHAKRSIRNCLAQYNLPDRLLNHILDNLGIANDDKASELNKKARKMIVSQIMGFPFEVGKLGGYKEAMATCGGVKLSEVNLKTMESRIVPGLFFAGEVLDIDGDTGGYNLQFAFSSGALAGQ